jgi:uncharacterized protein
LVSLSMSTRLLIDGYNLLFASDVFASPAGPPTLERTRTALLQFLADYLDDRLRGRTVVVFDATQAPAGLPHELSFAGMRALFSRSGQEADDLLEDLIAVERAPRELTVVSSDHRVQRAARQRGAKFVDSDVWLRELKTTRQRVSSAAPAEDPLKSSAEIQKWLAEFGDVDSRKLAPQESAPSPIKPAPPAVAKAAPPKKRSRPESDDDKPVPGHWNPFPPGYGDDLLGAEGEPRGED